MNACVLWSRILVIVGSIAMIVGAIDPLEGSIIIFLGSGFITVGTYLSKTKHRVLYWRWVFILITIGIICMWVLSAIGGIGGSTGRSLWWSIVILPYPIGWVMGMVSLASRLIEYLKARRNRKKPE